MSEEKKTCKPLKFNKKNMLALAEKIYHKDEATGEVKFKELCYGELRTAGTMNFCAVGAMKYTFLGEFEDGQGIHTAPAVKELCALVGAAADETDYHVTPSDSPLGKAIKLCVRANDADGVSRLRAEQNPGRFENLLRDRAARVSQAMKNVADLLPDDGGDTETDLGEQSSSPLEEKQ